VEKKGERPIGFPWRRDVSVPSNLGAWNLPAGQWPENRKIWSTVAVMSFDETGVCPVAPTQPDGHFTIGATTVYDPGGATISLFNGGTTVFRAMHDHAYDPQRSRYGRTSLCRIESAERSRLPGELLRRP